MSTAKEIEVQHPRGETVAVVNAVVRTFDEGQPQTEAFLVEQGVVTRVGSSDQILHHAPDVPVMDCHGAAVLPGFVDGHCHFELTCVTTDGWVNVHTPPHKTLESVAGAIRATLDDSQASEWILCRSSFAMNEKVAEGRLFDRHELDAITTTRPLAVFASLHVASLNTMALKRLGLWEPNSPHPFHGVVHRDGLGVPTGVVTEVFMMVPSPGSDSTFSTSVTAHARDMFNAAGTTSVHTMPESIRQVEIQRELHARGALSLRQKYFLISPGVATLDEADELARVDSSKGSFEFGGIKVFVNGCGHDGLGIPLDDVKWTQEALDDFVVDADSRGFQVWLHSLNSQGVRMAARSILRAAPKGDNPRRHRIEHGADFIDLADLAVIRESGALLVTTPQFLHSMTTDPTGPRAPLRSLLAAGLRVVGGTDSTGTVPTSVSILRNVETAVGRRRADGSGFHPEEAIDIYSAFSLFTTGSSYGAFSEQTTGRIRPGMYADFTVLGDDPFASEAPPTGGIGVEATYIGGSLVWSARDTQSS